MPAQFFQPTDDKPTGTDLAYRQFTAFMRRNNFQLSPAITVKADITDAIDEIWDGLGGDIGTIRAEIVGNLNTQASDVEVALLAMFVLQQKFIQYVATLPGAGGP